MNANRYRAGRDLRDEHRGETRGTPVVDQRFELAV